MKQVSVSPVTGWKRIVDDQGFDFHSIDGNPYWTEDSGFAFSSDEVALIRTSTDELYRCCLLAVQNVIQMDRFAELSISEKFIPMIRKSWSEQDLSIYGRFDFTFLEGVPKLLEFNADTPTSLLESAVIQYYWLCRYQHSFNKPVTQFNSIQGNLIEAWSNYRKSYMASPGERLYFTCIEGYPEDLKNVEYIRDCAEHAGIETDFLFLHEIGWKNGDFVDLDDKAIRHLFKLYPWEMLVEDEFSQHLLGQTHLRIVEPPWKMILSNKAILSILWELFPDHPNLLPAFFSESKFAGMSYVQKPVYSREGANIKIVQETGVTASDGIYADGPCVFQMFCELPKFDRGHAMVGSWIAGGKASGICVRQSDGLITGNLSRFVPHFIL